MLEAPLTPGAKPELPLPARREHSSNPVSHTSSGKLPKTMSVCPTCRRERNLPPDDPTRCGCPRSLRARDAAAIATEFCGKPPRLAGWWQSVTRTEIPPAEVNLAAFAGGVLLGPAGMAAGMLATGANQPSYVYSGNLGVIAVEDEAVWLLQCSTLYLGESNRLQESQIAFMIRSWQEGDHPPETTRIPANQVSCQANHPDLVVKYGPRSWKVQLCDPQMIPGQPGLFETVEAIRGGVTVPPVAQFMNRMTAADASPEPRLLDAVAADADYMKKVLSKAARMRTADLARFLAVSAATTSGFRVLIGGWVAEHSEGADRLFRTVCIWLAVAALAIAALFLLPPPELDEPAVPQFFAKVIAAIALGLAAWRGFQLRRSRWFRRQLPQFQSS